MIKTFQYRVKDSTTAKHLAAHARTVNWIWNFCNDTQKHALKWNKRWPSGFDLSNLCAGSSRELRLHLQTVQAICETYAGRRSENNRPYLRYRGRKANAHLVLEPDINRVKRNARRYRGQHFLGERFF